MDFLKSAVASAISKGPAFPYSFGDRVDIDNSIWTLHNGTKREDSSKCSIFSFDVTANKSRLPLARNALRKLRTLRHPGVIKVLDTVETETYIYIATERLVPLGWHTRRQSLSEETIKWGLHNVAKTLKFINSDASSVHGVLRVSSIFTSESAEWKVGGFDVLSSMNDDEAVLFTYGNLVPDWNRYAAPEVAKGGWDVVKRNPLHAVDAYDFGIMMFETFNGGFMGADQVGQTKNIPPSMQQSYKRLVNANPKARLSIAQSLEQGQRNGGFFQTPLIHLTEGIESLGLKNEAEREEFLSQLDDLSEDFPEEFFKMKVLPELLKSVEFGGGGPKVLNVVMKISKKLSEDEYDAKITPVIIRLFSLPDRAIRVCLLDNLPLMIDHLSQKVVTDKIFPQMVTGFTDTAPVLREQTVKAVLTIITKLSDRTINGELLRHLAKTANDEQPGIRTNTTICLGKIARNLSPSTRTKVLTAAFTRSLRDPFVHARNAALLALAATSDAFSEDDCASKILPAICPSLVDKEKMVRDQAYKALEIYLARIKKYSQTLPETILPPPSVDGRTAGGLPQVNSPPPGANASWTGWAISSFTNKLAAASGEIASAATSGTSSEQRSQSVPPTVEVSHHPPTLKHSVLNQQSSRSASSLAHTVIADEPVDSGWGDDWNADQKNEDDFGAAWGEEAEDPWAEPKKAAGVPATTYDDQGEPDFAGWLEAQSKTKKSINKPLPKGLTKSSAARPTATKANSTGNVGAKKLPLAQKPKINAPKPEIVKKQTEEEEEGWGDAW